MKTLSYLVALVMMFAGIYYGKLLYDRDLAIAKSKDPSPDDGGAKPTPEPTAKPVPTPVATPTPEPEAKLTADDEKRLEYPLKDLASGQFQSAVDGAHQISLDSAASVGLRAAGRRLEEKAKLFQVLMQASRPHKFVGAQDLVAVTLAATGARYVARVVEETDKNVKLSLDDGRELEVRPDQIKKREKLPPNAWSEQQRAKLEKKKTELGDPSALELFHLAFDSFEYGLPEDGTKLLEKALSHPAGGAIVDVYGTGDLDMLHRAQERMGGTWRPGGGDSSSLAQASGSHERPTPAPDDPKIGTPAPTTQTPVATSPEAQPTVAPDGPVKPMNDLDKLEADRRWQDAHTHYSKGVEAYRLGFKGITSIEKKSLKEAEAELAKARALLDELPRDLGQANSKCDEFNAKVNEILRAVKKQRAATGS